jgi:hypothetical protein
MDLKNPLQDSPKIKKMSSQKVKFRQTSPSIFEDTPVKKKRVTIGDTTLFN